MILCRQYINNNYLDIKSKNPNFPFIVRECLNAQPTVMARYDFGVEKRIYVPNLDEKDVDEVVKELVDQAREVNAAIPNNSRI
jgi:NADH dehydrogenase (ubiquinone) 1 alpha subcomplex subunit 2